MVNKKLLDKLTIVSAMLFIALSAIRTISTPEFWSALARTSFSKGIISIYPSDNFVNISYLYDWLLNLFWNIGGAHLIIYINVIGLVLAFFILLKVSYKYGSSFSQSLALLLSGVLLFRSIDINSISLMMIMIGLFLLILTKTNKSRSDYIKLIILQIFWTNLDSSFLIGPLLILGFIIQGVIDDKKNIFSIKTEFIFFIILIISTLINPNLIKAHFQAYNIFWNSNDVYFSSLIYDSFSSAESIKILLYATAVIGIIGLICSKKKLPLALIIFSFIGFFFAFTHPTHNALFVTLSFPIIVLSFETIKLLLINILKISNVRIFDKIGYILIPVISLFLIISLVNNKAYLLTGSCSNFGCGVSNSFIANDLPPKLKELIINEKINVINQISDGGYFASTFNKKSFTDYKIHLDNNPDENKELNLMLSGSSEEYTNFIKKYNPDIFILNALNKFTSSGLISLIITEKWNVVYFDGITLILISDKIYSEDLNYLDNGLSKLENFKKEFINSKNNNNPLPLIGALNVYSDLARNNLNTQKTSKVSELLSSIILNSNKNNINAYIQLGTAQLFLNKTEAAENTFSDGLKLSNNILLWERYKIACELNENNDGVDKANNYLNSQKKIRVSESEIISNDNTPLFEKTIN